MHRALLFIRHTHPDASQSYEIFYSNGGRKIGNAYHGEELRDCSTVEEVLKLVPTLHFHRVNGAEFPTHVWIERMFVFIDEWILVTDLPFRITIADMEYKHDFPEQKGAAR